MFNLVTEIDPGAKVPDNVSPVYSVVFNVGCADAVWGRWMPNAGTILASWFAKLIRGHHLSPLLHASLPILTSSTRLHWLWSPLRSSSID